MKLNFFLLLLTFLAAVTLTSALDSDSSDSGDKPKRIVGVLGTSTTVKVINFTTGQLKLVSKSLSGGVWDPPPPEIILRSNQAQWRSKSNFLGIDGSVIYQSDHGPISIHWDNPSIKSNVYSISCPKEYHCNYSGGGGTNAVVTFSVGKL